MLRLDRADRRHQFTHAVVIGVTHIDAKNVGAGLEQAPDHGAVPGGRAERRHDFGALVPPHWLGLLAGAGVAGGAPVPPGGAVPPGAGWRPGGPLDSVSCTV